MGRFLKQAPPGSLTAFIGQPLLVEEVIGKNLWRLQRDVIYETDAGSRIVAPYGMLTDFASIPRFVWPLWPPYDTSYGKAAVIHDRMYQTNGNTPRHQYTRRETNLIFLEAMKSLGAGYFKRSTIFNAVQLFSRRW